MLRAFGATVTQISLAALMLVVLQAPVSAHAIGPTDQLRGFFTNANKILAAAEDREPDDVLNAVFVLVRTMVAFPEAAELALGAEWLNRTPTERDAFVPLFADLLERAFVLRLAGAARARTGVELTYRDEFIAGDLASVQAVVVGKDGNDIPLAFLMIRRDAGWAVVDLGIHGVSIVSNYHAQFTRIVREASYGELVARLRAKTTTMATAGDLVAPRPATTAPAHAPAALPLVPAAVVEEDADEAKSREHSVAPLPAGPSLAEPASAVVPAAEYIAAAPKATSAPSPVARRYWVQVGAFKDIERASRVAARLLADHRSVAIAPARSLTRVRVGPFADRAEATSELRALERGGYRPFIAEER